MYQTPVDIDDTCIDQQRIRELQMRQAAGDSRYEEGTITTVLYPSHYANKMLGPCGLTTTPDDCGSTPFTCLPYKV